MLLLRFSSKAVTKCHFLEKAEFSKIFAFKVANLPISAEIRRFGQKMFLLRFSSKGVSKISFSSERRKFKNLEIKNGVCKFSKRSSLEFCTGRRTFDNFCITRVDWFRSHVWPPILNSCLGTFSCSWSTLQVTHLMEQDLG